MQLLCTLGWKAICDALLRWHLGRLLLHWCRLQSKREYTPACVFYFGIRVCCVWFKEKNQHPASSDNELFSSDCLCILALCSLTGSAEIFLIWFSCDSCDTCSTWAGTSIAMSSKGSCGFWGFLWGSYCFGCYYCYYYCLIAVLRILSHVRLVEFCWMGS